MSKRSRHDDSGSDSECDSPEAKRIREDLLEILDEPAEATQETQEAQDLASVMKSFEEEISNPAPAEEEPEMGLGYLFEASDDELGLPPAKPAEEEVKDGNEEDEVVSVPYEYGLDDEQMWRFEDEMESYDFGVLGENSGNTEFLALDGLFDYSDVYSGQQSDLSDFLYRPESLSAL